MMADDQLSVVDLHKVRHANAYNVISAMPEKQMMKLRAELVAHAYLFIYLFIYLQDY